MFLQSFITVLAAPVGMPPPPIPFGPLPIPQPLPIPGPMPMQMPMPILSLPPPPPPPPLVVPYPPVLRAPVPNADEQSFQYQYNYAVQTVWIINNCWTNKNFQVVKQFFGHSRIELFITQAIFHKLRRYKKSVHFIFMGKYIRKFVNTLTRIRLIRNAIIERSQSSFCVSFFENERMK